MKAFGSIGLNRPERSRSSAITLVMSWPTRESCGCAPENGDTAIGIGCDLALGDVDAHLRLGGELRHDAPATAIAAAPLPSTARRDSRGEKDALDDPSFSFRSDSI